jgi:hypothetical protein
MGAFDYRDGNLFGDVFGVEIFPGAMSYQTGPQMNHFGSPVFELLGASYNFIGFAAAATAAGIESHQVNGLIGRKSSGFIPHRGEAKVSGTNQTLFMTANYSYFFHPNPPHTAKYFSLYSKPIGRTKGADAGCRRGFCHLNLFRGF